MVQVFYCNTQLFCADMDRLKWQLPPERRYKFDQYLRKEDKLQCLGGGLLLSRILGKDYHKKLRFNSYGKPYLQGHSKYFNLSHSGNYVFLAVGDSKVGIDIQCHEDGDYISMSKVSFHPAEQKYLAASSDLQSAFYSIWSLKESYMKAVGLGFSLSPQSFSIQFVHDKPQLSIPCNYNLHMIHFYSGYSLSLCTREPILTPNPQMIVL